MMLMCLAYACYGLAFLTMESLPFRVAALLVSEVSQFFLIFIGGVAARETPLLFLCIRSLILVLDMTVDAACGGFPGFKWRVLFFYAWPIGLNLAFVHACSMFNCIFVSATVVVTLILWESCLFTEVFLPPFVCNLLYNVGRCFKDHGQYAFWNLYVIYLNHVAAGSHQEKISSVAVHIATKDEGEKLISCVDSVRRSVDYAKESLPHLKWKIVLLDGNSTDGSVERVKVLVDNVICLSGGKCEARARSAQIAVEDVIVSLDADRQYFRNALIDLVAPLLSSCSLACTATSGMSFYRMNGGACAIFRKVQMIQNLKYVRNAAWSAVWLEEELLFLLRCLRIGRVNFVECTRIYEGESLSAFESFERMIKETTLLLTGFPLMD
jgi:hypothetical protein